MIYIRDILANIPLESRHVFLMGLAQGLLCAKADERDEIIKSVVQEIKELEENGKKSKATS